MKSAGVHTNRMVRWWQGLPFAVKPTVLGRAAVFVLCFLLAACAGRTPDIQPLTFNPTPWQNGEISLFRVTDVNGDYAGTARYDLTRNGDGWMIRYEIVAHGDNEVVAVTTAGERLKPVAASLVRTTTQGIETVNTTYADGQVDMELTTSRGVTTYQREQIPSDARDQQTILMMARMLPLAPGYAVRFNSYLPITGRLSRVTLTVQGREEVETPVARFDTWRVRMDVAGSRTELWIGVDAPQPLVKYLDGRSGGLFELAEFTPGVP